MPKKIKLTCTLTLTVSVSSRTRTGTVLRSSDADTMNINTPTQMEKDLVQNGVDLHISGFPKSKCRRWQFNFPSEETSTHIRVTQPH
jgi:hypothetical protein